jgi:hypothetical protein
MGEFGTAWANFFVAEAGATAALAGLTIVAVSINLERILSFPQLPGRAAEVLIMLVGALLVCSLGLMPGQSLKAFGVEVLGAGLLMTASPLIIQARQVTVLKTQPLSWWLYRHLITLFGSVPVLIGGVYLVAGTTDGLYWMAAGILATLAGAVWNAWVLLVEILR